MTTHEPFACPSCEQTFPTRSAREVHATSHAPVRRPYETPKLTRLGHVSDLTYGQAGSTGESAVRRNG